MASRPWTPQLSLSHSILYYVVSLVCLYRIMEATPTCATYISAAPNLKTSEPQADNILANPTSWKWSELKDTCYVKWAPI